MPEGERTSAGQERAGFPGVPQELDTLTSAIRALGATNDAGPALNRIAAAARQLAGADVAYVIASEPGSGVPRVLASSDSGATTAPRGDQPREGGEVSLPLVVEDEVVGQLAVAWPRGRRTSDVDMEALGRLAGLAALAVRHHRLAMALVPGRDLGSVRAGDLLRTAGQLRRIVDAAKDGIVTTDAGGLITSANPAAEALFGYRADALFGRPVTVVLPGVQLGGAAANPGGAGHELEGVRADASRFPAELSVSTVASDTGRAFVVIVRDVTQRRAVEEMKDEFVATVSHELRTPLTALRGHVELVLDGDGGPVTDLQRRFLQIATQSADRLGALINDLLDVAKIEAGRVQLRKELVDLGAVLREVSITFQVEATRHGLAFREDLPQLPAVVGDRDRLIQVFGNLVSNAIKYTRAGEVGVTARPTYGAVEVMVHDTGVGMTPEEQRQLFTKFFRSRDRMGPDPGGTGLGLVIVKGIVEGHGGTLAVESELGVGTRVRVTLPAVSGQAAPAADRGREAATVLVVDDEVTIRDLLLEYLQVWGYGAVPAGSGAEALELAGRIKPDLIILDVGMLPMSGLDVLRQLKQNTETRAIPVLLHSVADEPNEMLALGATDFLRKPVTGARLREAVTRALDRTPVPVFVLDGDEGRRERVRRVLEDTGVPVSPARTLAEAVAIPPTPPPVVVLGPTLTDGASAELLARWSADPLFRDASVILAGPWPADSARRDRGCHVEVLRGQRAADAAARVRALIADRRVQGQDAVGG
ncbi:MAG TPA: ATP-binding protein [Methylomirabilota bacterium]|jgi:PAS domain S-box-containing protein